MKALRGKNYGKIKKNNENSWSENKKVEKISEKLETKLKIVRKDTKGKRRKGGGNENTKRQ